MMPARALPLEPMPLSLYANPESEPLEMPPKKGIAELEAAFHGRGRETDSMRP